MDREKEREMELESATYTNCLLLGLDPTVIGLGSTTANPRVGLFRHSNPKLGEHLLYFILSSLRGPIQSSKDFDRVWPIFDSAQSRDFRKVVQGIISELESQGALPRSNSRVSSLATCCGPRFVELLWQLSLHALREVHRRSFAIDLASNPLPAPLTDVAFTNAAALLPVTKARIALERRKFLKNAEAVVQRQTMWSNLAHEMTSEFRALCAEEAYLQQELETLHDLRNKVKLEGEHWDELVSSSSQNSCMVQRATYLWDSLLSRKSEHELLSSGPIEDLITHREHRYRISGSSLLAAMEQSSLSSSTNLNSQHMDNEQTDSSQLDGKNEVDLSHGNEELTSQSDERNARWQASVDIAEVLRRWTHALQRIHKQSLQLAKANNGEAPGLLRSAQDGGAVSHAESLAAAVAEHRQHLDSIQVLINQVKDVAPAIQNSILELTEEVNSASSNLPLVTNLRASSTIEALGAGRVLENGTNDIVEISSRMSSAHIDNELDRIPTLKLPPLFSSTPSSGKSGSMQKQHNLAEIRDIGSNIEKKQPPSNHLDNDPPHDADILSLHELKISVREAALSSLSSNLDLSEDSRSNDSFEHFLVPFCGTGFSQHGQDRKLNSRRTRQSFTSQEDSSLIWMHSKDNGSKHHGVAYMLNDMDSLDEFDSVNGFLSVSGSNLSVSDAQISLYDTDEAPDQVFSPPLLMDASLLVDAYEDLLAPLSETETALMEH